MEDAESYRCCDIFYCFAFVLFVSFVVSPTFTQTEFHHEGHEGHEETSYNSLNFVVLSASAGKKYAFTLIQRLQMGGCNAGLRSR